MITFEQAREKAQLKLLALASEQLTSDFTILDDQVQERKRGWVLPYNTKRFTETKNPQDGLVGNGPIFVDRDSGEVYALPSGGYRRWLDEYDETGVAPARDTGMRWAGEGPAAPFPSPSSGRRHS